MDAGALNLLTILVLTPLFVVAAVGGFFLVGARQTWKGGAASFLSFSTAVAIPLFAFRWRSGVPFVEALLTAALTAPLIVAALLIVGLARPAGSALGSRLAARLARPKRPPPGRDGNET